MKKAPELVKAVPYNHKVDIWSVGILAVELFNKEPPFYNVKNQYQVMRMIETSTKPPKINNHDKMSPDLQDFIAKCLVVSKTKRTLVCAIPTKNTGYIYRLTQRREKTQGLC